MVFGRRTARTYPSGGSAFRESQQNRGVGEPEDGVKLVAVPESAQPIADEEVIYVPGRSYFTMVRSMSTDPEILSSADRAEDKERQIVKAKLPGDMTRSEIDISFDYLGTQIIESQRLQRALFCGIRSKSGTTVN